MKNVFVALTLLAFTGSYAATSYAAVSTNNTEVLKDKADKGKKKKKDCKKGGSCCHKKAEA